MPVYITKSPSTTSSTCSIPWRKTEYMQILENFSRCLPPTFSYLIKSRSVPLCRGLHGGETGRKQPKESSQIEKTAWRGMEETVSIGNEKPQQNNSLFFSFDLVVGPGSFGTASYSRAKVSGCC